MDPQETPPQQPELNGTQPLETPPAATAMPVTPPLSTPAAPTPSQTASPAPEAAPPAPIPMAMPAEPATDPTSLPPQNLSPLPPATNEPGNGKKRLALIVIIILVLAIVGAAVYLLLSQRKATAALTVNGNPYLYACSATTPDEMTSTLGFGTDRNLQSVETTYQYAPADTKDKQLDVLKTTGAQRANNTCQVFVARQAASKDNPSPDSDNVYTSIDQFRTAADASTALQNNKQNTDKPLPGFENSGFYTQPEADSSSPGTVTISAFIAYKSAMIGYVLAAPSSASADQYAPKFEALARSAIANIDSGKAAKVTSFNGYTSIGGNGFADACTAVNYTKLTPLLLGGIDLNIDNVSSTQEFGKDAGYQSPQSITSVCSFMFRANSEVQTEQGLNLSSTKSGDTAGNDDTAAYDAKFSHTLSIGLTSVTSASQVQQAIKDYNNSPESSNLTKVTLDGQSGYKTTSNSKDDSGNTLDVYQYFLPKGAQIYTLQVVLRRQTKPYNTTTASFSDAEASKILGVVSQAQPKN